MDLWIETRRNARRIDEIESVLAKLQDLYDKLARKYDEMGPPPGSDTEEEKPS